MITLQLDWREVLLWMQGGMSGSHLRWNVYEDMVKPDDIVGDKQGDYYFMAW